MHKMEVDLIIKFGGSAITDKNIFETIRRQELSIAAQCIKTCTDHGLKCIVVHGAGSFGHHQAKQYAVNSGLTYLKTKEDYSLKVQGYCLTRQSVTKLNQMVVDSLLQSGVPAVACSPGSSWTTSDREPLHSPCEVIAGFVNTGLVPVLHGDCSLDEKLGCCILSGDTVIKTLCSKLTVKKVIFLTDVAGIYDRPPDQPGAQLIKSIKVNPNGEISSSISASQSAHDVTGGILLKLKTAINIIVQTEGKCCVYIMGINSSDVKEVCLTSGSYCDHWLITKISSSTCL